MKISTKTRYGVRAIFDLAYHCSGTSAQVKDISKRQNISQRYLEQIFHRLKKAGIVKSERGPKGGYILTKPPKEITLGDIYRAVDKSFDLVPCKSRKGNKCEQLEECVTMPVWEKISKEVEKIFDSITIEDLCNIATEKNIPRDIENKYMYFI